jgi:hypothetical protein
MRECGFADRDNALAGIEADRMQLVSASAHGQFARFVYRLNGAVR